MDTGYLDDDQQLQLYNASSSENVAAPESFLPQPPSYHEAIQSLGWISHQTWTTLDHDLSRYMDEVDGHPTICHFPTPGLTHGSDFQPVLPPSTEFGTSNFLGQVESSVVPEPYSMPLPTSTPYPTRPPSNPAVVPGSSQALAECLEYSLYNMDKASSSAADSPESPMAQYTTPLNPGSDTVSILPDMEHENLNVEGSFKNQAKGALGGKKKNKKKRETRAVKTDVPFPWKWEDAATKGSPEDRAQTGGDEAEVALYAKKGDFQDEKKKLLEDVHDQVLLECAQRVMETSDPSLLTKMMLKTKLELHYMSMGQALPDLANPSSKGQSRQLRPDEEEKVDQRRRIGRVSAKTYRTKVKRIKQEKEMVLQQLTEKNTELKSKVSSIEEQIKTLRQKAIKNHILPATTSTTTSTTTATATSTRYPVNSICSSSKTPTSGDAGSFLFPARSTDAAAVADVPSSSRQCHGMGVDFAMFPLTPPPR